MPTDMFSELLKYGVPGFAVILLFLGYRLLTQVLKSNSDDQNFKAKLIGVGTFMLTSLLFLFGSIFGQAYLKEQEDRVDLVISPTSMPAGFEMPIITHSATQTGAEIYINKGRATLTIKDKDNIMIDLSKITSHIETDRKNKDLLSEVKLSN